MSRKSPPLTMIGGLFPRERAWAAIRELAPSFTASELSRMAKVESSIISEYLRGLVAAGVLSDDTSAAMRTVRGYVRRYRLERDEGLEAPRVRRDGSRLPPTGHEAMWRTLQMMPVDTNARELSAHASTFEVAVAEGAAKDYLHMLHLSGYLTRTAPGKGLGKGGKQARFRLAPGRNSGPRPPMVLRLPAVYDPNTDRIVWRQEAVTGEESDHA